MDMSWIFVIFLVIESTWAKVIPIKSTTNHQIQKRMDENTLSSYPGWQPLNSELQTSLKQPESLQNEQTQNGLPQVGVPRADGVQPQKLLGQIPQIEIFKTSSVQFPQNLESPINVPDEKLSGTPQLEIQNAQSQALHGLPYLKSPQLYQIQPNSFPPNKLIYYRAPNLIVPRNNPEYYHVPKLNDGDSTEILGANSYEQSDVPSRTLTVPKQTHWNPANHPALFYGASVESQDNNSNQTENNDLNVNIQAPVRTIPKHYKFEKNLDQEKQKSKSKDKSKNSVKSNKIHKNKDKNNSKESSDQISTVLRNPKGSASSVEANNEWVPVVRAVPKHYTFEKNSIDNKLKPKNKKKTKGEQVEKVTKPKNYIFEEGTFIKKFKEDKYREQEPLEEESLDEPKSKKKYKKSKVSKEKIKPVQEILEPELPIGTNEKEIELLEHQTQSKKNLKPKTSRPRDQINSESYLNHQGKNNFHHETAGFNQDLNGAQSHGAAPPASKDRTMYHMVGHDGPMSYKWGFDTGAGKQRQYRFEERDKEGIVKGQFGYLDDKGKFRKMNYHAHPIHGFSMEPADGTFDDLKQ